MSECELWLGGCCPYCARTVERLTIEHVIPHRVGGALEVRCTAAKEAPQRSVDPENPGSSCTARLIGRAS